MSQIEVLKPAGGVGTRTYEYAWSMSLLVTLSSSAYLAEQAVAPPPVSESLAPELPWYPERPADWNVDWVTWVVGVNISLSIRRSCCAHVSTSQGDDGAAVVIGTPVLHSVF